MSIKIGDNTSINKSKIVSKDKTCINSKKPSFFTKHPWLSGIICSLIAGIILLFSFWDKIITFIENLS